MRRIAPFTRVCMDTALHGYHAYHYRDRPLRAGTRVTPCPRRITIPPAVYHATTHIKKWSAAWIRFFTASHPNSKQDNYKPAPA